MSRPWILLVDPSDATLDGARAAIERWYDVVAVDAEKDARYALTKWEMPAAVAVRLALERSDDGLELAGKLRQAVGDDILVVVFGKPESPLRDADKFLLRHGIDAFKQIDLRGDDLGSWVHEELKTGTLVRQRQEREAAEEARRLDRERRADAPEERASDVVDSAVDQVQSRRVHVQAGQRESTWSEILDAQLNGPNLATLWDKANGRPAYLRDR